MEKLSRVLTGLMLLLCGMLLLYALLLGTLFQMEHRSYLAALVMALFPVTLWLLLSRKRSNTPSLWQKLGLVPSAALLCLLCLGVQLAGALPIHLQPEVDAGTYWASALALSRGEAVPNPVFLALFPHIVGYARFLGLVLRVFGRSLTVAVCCNALVSTLSGLLLYLLLLRWRDPDTAARAFLLWALCPSKLLYCAGIYADGYYTCLLLLFFLLVSLAERARPLSAALLGLLGGLVLLLVNTARPIAAVPILALGIWALLLRRPDRAAPAARGRWLLFLAALLVLYLPLQSFWNRDLEGLLGEKPAGVPGYSIYVGFNSESDGSYSEEDMQRLLTLRDETGSADAAQRQILQEALPRIRSVDPLRLFPRKLATFLGNDEGGAFYASPALSPQAYRVAAVASNVFFYAVVLLALCGLLRLWKDRCQSALLLLPLSLIGITLAQMLVEVAGRYHYSLIPILVLLAAIPFGKR
ncbi:MAG: hypothetical protein IJQ42_03340 [Oscillospiraceae bacterium]|nr:hypothetical protein [Oscillospiraceae bacterium]